MFERYTDRARKVMALANQEAQRFNHEYIGTEHILLGLVKEGSGVGANVLKNLDVDLRKVRLEVESLVRSGPDMIPQGKLPLSPAARQALEYAVEEAHKLSHNYAGTEHLLLGLVRQNAGVAVQVLMNLNLSLERVREEVLITLKPPSGTEESARETFGQTGFTPLPPRDGSVLRWSKRLFAIAQTGLNYAQSPFDVQRYEEIRSIAAEMMASRSTHSPGALVELFKADRGYATPKVDVRGFVFRDNKLLLVREKEDGLWTPPGGWVDVGDPPSLAVEKEVEQESGFTAKAKKLIAVFNRDQHGHTDISFSVYKLHIICELTGGAAAISEETTEVAFFARDEIPALSTARIVAPQIARAFEHHDHPDWPCDFD
jgi:ADP-ribose pyrophosphatase YjhB (NUDIX family)